MNICWLICNRNLQDIEICKQLLKNGYKVGVAIFVDKEKKNDVQFEIDFNTEVDNGQIKLFEFFNFGDSYSETIRQLKEFGEASVVINHFKGDYLSESIEVISNENIKKLIDLSVNSLYYFTKEIIPTFISKKSGKIVVINDYSSIKYSSAIGNSGSVQAASYGFLKSISKEYERYKVNCINFIIDDKRGDVQRIAKNICDILAADYGVTYQEMFLN